MKIKFLSIGIVLLLLSSAIVLPSMNEEYEVTPLMDGSLIIDMALEFMENETVINAIESAKFEINSEIDKLDLDNVNKTRVRKFFNIDETFDKESIIKRILSLDGNNLIESMHDVVGVSDGYNEFNDSVYLSVSRLFYTFNFSDGGITGFYPLCELICALLKGISLIWLIPIWFLFGSVGMIIASLITYVCFMPIFLPMSVYIGLAECINNDAELKDKIIATFVLFGAIGVIVLILPLLLITVWECGYLDDGFAWTFDKFVISLIFPNFDEYDVLTSEMIPYFENIEFSESNYESPYPPYKLPKRTYMMNEEVTIIFQFADNDTLQNYDERDTMQIMYDWTDDYIPDEKSGFDYVNYDTLTIKKRWDRIGVFNMKVRVRDMWGCSSEWYCYNIVIVNEKDKSFNGDVLWNLPFVSHTLEFIHNIIPEVKQN